MSEVLKGVGVLAQLGGAALMFFAFRADVNAYPTGLGDPVANLAAMHFQLMWFLLGAFVFLDGTLCWIGGAVLDQMRTESNRVLRGDEPDPIPEVYSSRLGFSFTRLISIGIPLA